jgi:hypothetical protein
MLFSSAFSVSTTCCGLCRAQSRSGRFHVHREALFAERLKPRDGMPQGVQALGVLEPMQGVEMSQKLPVSTENKANQVDGSNVTRTIWQHCIWQPSLGSSEYDDWMAVNLQAVTAVSIEQRLVSWQRGETYLSGSYGRAERASKGSYDEPRAASTTCTLSHAIERFEKGQRRGFEGSQADRGSYRKLDGSCRRNS